MRIEILPACYAITACIISLTTAESASAAVLETQTVELGHDFSEVFGEGGHLPDMTKISLPYYSGAGTLKEVDISYSVTDQVLGFVTQRSLNTTLFDVGVSFSEDFQTDPDAHGPAPLDNLEAKLPQNNVDYGLEYYTDVPFHATVLYGGFSASGGGSVRFADPADVSEFLGSGNYLITDFANAYGQIGKLVAPPDNFVFSFVAYDYGSLTLTYIGDPAVAPPPPPAVPEPATWGMMLVGFAGVGAAIRSRRKHGARAV